VIGPGAAVLEIGCGTAQLTRMPAGRTLSVTAIDIGVAMVAAGRRAAETDDYRFPPTV
jgi:ubiquinone/menaquinone biosynthesis C-methylase UbiE